MMETGAKKVQQEEIIATQRKTVWKRWHISVA